MSSADQHTDRPATMVALFISAGLSSSGYIAAIIVAPLLAEDLLGSTVWSGFPSAMTIIGMAVGSTALASLMARRGRRAGLLLGYAVVAVAAAVAALATAIGSFVLFTIGMFALGTGHSANRLTRYAASDLYSAAHRASAIGWIIWAGTIGSVLGPALLEPARRFAARAGVVGSAGPFFVTVGGALCAMAVLRGVMPRLPASTILSGEAKTVSGRRHLLELLAVPNVQIAVAALVTSQAVMVLLMTMTPVHIRGAGGAGFGAIGLVIGVHAFGMYALSPLTGHLTDRLGRIPIILVGAAMLIASTFLASNASGAETTRLTAALFLLGLGWNFGFVAGSTLLTDSVPEGDRVRLQGMADSLVWTTGAAASLGSGVLLSTWGYPVLSVIGTALSLIPVLTIGKHKFVPRATR